ncbi:MAG: response regulator [Bryobacterales bacterium]|nr:response regulator [Bryobacterales bacterium]
MSRILLADRSSHAQRMGERILREEGFEVVTVSSGENALLRLEDVDPDLLLVDAFLPDVSGFDICERVKGRDGDRRIPVALTAGELETVDDERLKRAQADALLRKPFEASVFTSTVKRLLGEEKAAAAAAPRTPPRRPPPVALIDPERVRAAVTLALDAALPAMIEEVTRRVLIALSPGSPTSNLSFSAPDQNARKQL